MLQTQLQEQNSQLLISSDEHLFQLVQHLNADGANYRQLISDNAHVKISRITLALLDYLHRTTVENRVIYLRYICESVYLLSRILVHKLAFLLHIPEESVALEEEEAIEDALVPPSLAAESFLPLLRFLTERDRGVVMQRNSVFEIVPDATSLAPQMLSAAIATTQKYSQDIIPFLYAVKSDKTVLIDRCIGEITVFLKSHRLCSFHSLLRRFKQQVSRNEFCTQFFSVLLLCSDKKLSIKQSNRWQNFTIIYSG